MTERILTAEAQARLMAVARRLKEGRPLSGDTAHDFGMAIEHFVETAPVIGTPLELAS